MNSDPQQLGKHDGISRREMVQKLMGGVSSGLIVSGTAAAQPATAEPTPSTAPAETGNKSGNDAGAPRFFDAHQSETLAVLAELIVPGSTKAEVAPFLDLLLGVDTAENQEKFIASLSAIDGEALNRYQAPFKSLDQARQIELLKFASTAASAQFAKGKGQRISPSLAGTPEIGLREHFENLKSWVSKAYYSSEVGMRELGWKDEYFYETFSE